MTVRSCRRKIKPFFETYKLLRVKKAEDLRFTPTAFAELKKKFIKHSQVGIQVQQQKEHKNNTQKILNPNAKLYFREETEHEGEEGEDGEEELLEDNFTLSPSPDKASPERRGGERQSFYS